MTRKLIIIDAAFCVLDKKGSVFIATADAAKQENNLLHAPRSNFASKEEQGKFH